MLASVPCRRSAELTLLVLLTGCTEVGSYATRPGEAYAGRVRGTREASFFRRGFPAGTQMRLALDPLAEDVVGVLRTDDSQCGEPTFRDTELRAIEPLRHDLLSQLDFPGGERLRNYLLVARPERGALAGRDVTVVLSLMRDGRVEVRILAGWGRACDEEDCAARAAGRCDYFGVFDLRRPEEGVP